MRYLKKVLGGGLRQYSMVIALVALTLIFNITSGGRMITSSNFQNLISGNAYVLVLAIGMLMVIVIGQIDLSVGSVAGFSGMVMALAARDLGWPWWLAVLLSLAIGAAAGAWQGFWLSRFGIPGFITTLGGMMIFRGGVIWISKSISVPAPTELKVFGSGYLPEWGPAFTGMNNSTLLLGILAIAAFAFTQLRRRKRSAALTGKTEELWPVVVRIILVAVVIGYITWIFGTGRTGTSFPIPGLILVVLVIIYNTITQRTRFGRHVYAVGGNKTSAALSGVNVQKTYFLTMLNMSLLAALAGIMFVGRSTAAGPSDGTGWEMDAIASVFIGGAAVSGGVGTITATMVGGLVMAVLNSGLMLMGVGADRTQVIKGFVLLAAVAFDVFNKQQGRASIIGRLFPAKEGKPQEANPASSDS
ncbi:sugar ABC transporter permease [Caproiciproducens faecalis]|uniref:Xylose transport system permease protein XylH n=1 Tax=Caproiciproducens faecalis TaxID=2820301 RepID=A0ABS7DJ05_9FIRM|nr:sugar ABC transporter permease [Caproiciproducens faecalis]MBW7571263.1 sugar ABC transporter permease [Caproiciproducens faecalis]